MDFVCKVSNCFSTKAGSILIRKAPFSNISDVRWVVPKRRVRSRFWQCTLNVPLSFIEITPYQGSIWSLPSIFFFNSRTPFFSFGFYHKQQTTLRIVGHLEDDPFRCVDNPVYRIQDGKCHWEGYAGVFVYSVCSP